MKEIITALLIWIGANTTYNVDVPLPNVYFMDQTQMNHLYYKHHEPIGELHGFYNLEKD